MSLLLFFSKLLDLTSLCAVWALPICFVCLIQCWDWNLYHSDLSSSKRRICSKKKLFFDLLLLNFRVWKKCTRKVWQRRLVYQTFPSNKLSASWKSPLFKFTILRYFQRFSCSLFSISLRHFFVLNWFTVFREFLVAEQLQF